jgi:F-type H+-transporting ATPase subunit b
MICTKALGLKANSKFRIFATTFLGVLLLTSATASLRAQKHKEPVQQAPASAGENTAPDSAVPEKKEEVRDENDEYRHSPMVVKLGGMMGLKAEAAATAFTVFNFLVLVIAIGYGLVKALPKTFRKRTSTIQKDLVDARTATEEAAARLSAVEARLAKLDGEIAAMKTHAEADSVREEQRIRASVEDESAKIVAAAEAEIVAATAIARREIQRYAADLAIDRAARKLVVTAETDRLLVESFAHRLSTGLDAGRGGQN